MLHSQTMLGISVAAILVLATVLYLRYKAWKTPIAGLPAVPGAHWLLGNINLFLGMHEQLVLNVNKLGEVLCFFPPLGSAGILGATTDFVDMLKDRTKVQANKGTIKILGAFFKNGLIALEGDMWKKHVRVLGPMLSVNSLKDSVNIMVEASADMESKWRSQVDSDKAYNIEADVKALSLAIIGEFMVGRKLGGDEGRDVMRHCEVLLEATETEIYQNPLIKMVFGERASVRQARKFLWGLMLEIMEECRTHPEQRVKHAIGRIMMAVESEGIEFSNEEMLDEVVMLVFAGSDTTAVSLTWALKNLSKTPDIQEKMRAEINSVLPNGRAPTYDDIHGMPYLDLVFKEVMRLARTAPSTSRTLAADLQVPGKPGVVVPKGGTLMLAISALHLSPRYWVDPELFWPERWEEGPGKGQAARGLPINHSAWAPFGAGQRGCFGVRMATLEMKVLMIQLIRSFEFLPTGDAEMDNWDMLERLTTRAKNPFFKIRAL